ncbi:hypothetical protein MN608_11708 [Microdochium nivale]|nr:hypothetical protein MN608_11708 [Microdochium nivale]
MASETHDTAGPAVGTTPIDWEKLRDFVLRASIDHDGAELAGLLREQRGVQATPAQVEARLRTWAGRRTARQKHWRVVLRAADDLVASGVQCRLLSEGQLLSEDEMKDIRGRHETDARDVFAAEDYAPGMLPEIDIEVLEATGEWVSLRSISEGAFVRQQEPTSAEPYAQPCNLPFEHFERAVFGDDPTQRQLLKQDSAAIQHVQQDMQRLVLEIQKATKSPRPMDPAALFLYLRSFTPRRQGPSINQHALPQLGRQQSHDNFTETFANRILIDKNDMSASTVLRMVLFSVANGFAGLDDIPTASIISHLRQQANATSLLRGILQLPGHTPRALADNLLKAAVEAKDTAVARMLLELRPKDSGSSTDINELRARFPPNSSSNQYKRDPLTLIEQAAKARDTEMIALLLAHGADPDKRLGAHGASAHRSLSGPLDLLVGNSPSFYSSRCVKVPKVEPQVRVDGLASARLLLGVGCSFNPSIVQSAAERGEMDLALLLALNVPPAMHRTMVSHGMIVKLVRRARTESEAIQVVDRFHNMCSSTGCGECPSRYGKTAMTWLLIEACWRRFLGVIDLLSSTHGATYAPHIRWEMVLGAAMRTRDAAVVDCVFAMNPDIANCKQYTIDRHTDDYRDNIMVEQYSTPLSEAIESRVARHIALCESRGALEAVRRDAEHRQCALEAAAAVGDLAYLHNIIGFSGGSDNIRPGEMTRAMAHAIMNGHDAVVDLLFDAGADVVHDVSHSPCAPDPLFAAILRRNLPVTHQILVAGSGGGRSMSDQFLHTFWREPRRGYPPKDEDLDLDSNDGPDGGGGAVQEQSSSLLEQAILWGRRDVVLGIKMLRPGAGACISFPSRELQACLRTNHGMLEFLASETLINADGLGRCLQHAFLMHDEVFLDRLLALGADAGSEAGLKAGITAPKLLRRVLRRAAGNEDGTARRPQQPGFGTEALIEAIRMENKAELEERARKIGIVMYMSQLPEDAAVDGRQVGREAVHVLLESGLIDVRFPRYSTSPMKEALYVYDKRLKERMEGRGGGEGLGTFQGPAPGDVGDCKEDLEIIRALLARGCHPDDSSHEVSGCYAQTTFLQAIATKNVAVVRLMLEHGATVNYPSARAVDEFFSSSGSKDSTEMATPCKTHFLAGMTRTPLQKAVEVNSLGIVDLLLNPDKYCSSQPSQPWPAADVNAPAAHRGGATALQIAAGQGNCGIAATLLAQGADINAAPARVWGKSALEAAAEGGRLEMVDLLRANGYVFDKKGCEKAIKAAEGNGEAGCAARIREISAEVASESRL